MELKLFSDFIDALGKVVSGLKALAQLPKAEREAIIRTQGETFRLIDTTLNMVIIRLGDLQLQTSEDDFLREVTRLDNYDDWCRAEREFRLCSSLRVARRETTTLAGRLVGMVSTKDWDALIQQMGTILTSENEVASFISEQFRQLAGDARAAGQDPLRRTAVRDVLSAFRASLIAERQALIKQELALFEVV